MYGSRGRIGLISLATDLTVQPEIARMVPEGIAVYAAPITLPRGEVTPESLAEMTENDELERAAEKLAWAEVDVILFACTSGSFIHGLGWDRELIARIEAVSNTPATTTSTTVIAALTAVKATALTVVTPYLDSVNDVEKAYFQANGFDVLSISGLGLEFDRDIARLSPSDAQAQVLATDTPQADAIFISCTDYHVLDAIDEIERTQGKPVVTSNQAGTWGALRKMGVTDLIPGAGRLMTLQLSAAI
ncbi:MAG: maleate cis-trans isomerase [Actinomycetes bacterium]